MRRVDLTALHGLRTCLTAWLVVHHATRWLLRGTDIDPQTVGLLRQRQGATSGFFVLSGVVLTYRWSQKLVDEPTIPLAAEFLRKRWAAIWPLGMVGALLAVPYELIEDRLSGGEYLVGLLSHALMVQSWLPVGGGAHGLSLRFDGPTWTLSTLFALYAAFPVIVWLVQRIRTRVGLVALALVPWLIILATAWSLQHEDKGTWMLHVSPLMRMADFLAGIAIGTWLVRYGGLRRRTAWAAQGAGVAMVVAAIWLAVALDMQRELRFGVLFIPPFAVLVAGLTVPGGPIGALLATRPLQFAGKRAFAVAMLHTPLLGLGWHAGYVRLDRPPSTAGVLATAVVLALAVHRWIEVPARSRLREAPRAG